MTRNERDRIYNNLYWRFANPIQTDLARLDALCNEMCDRKIKLERKILSMLEFVEKLDITD